ncbi:hypothetical protein HYT23_01675 [Candidatus Pacearchaeota archaeon]|nr:hypothetical protein [Candidatus Pacearchaeota archaeon]
MPEKEATFNYQREKLAGTSQTFRTLFLLMFTKELIRHSKVEEFFELQRVIKKEEPPKDKRAKEFKEKYPDLMPSIMYQDRNRRVGEPRRYLVIKPKPPLVIPKNPIVRELDKITKAPSMMQPLLKVKPAISIPSRRGPITIPEHPLPPPVRYVAPAPSSAIIDLGKLNLFVNDPSVSSIETSGPDDPVTIKTSKGVQSTKTILTKEDINQVLQKFSEASRIPLHDGILKIAVGKLILSAVVSDVIGSRFIIKKMRQQPQQIFRRY